MKRTALLLCPFAAFYLSGIAIAHTLNDIPRPDMGGLPPVSRINYFNQTYETTKSLPGCLKSKMATKPYVGALRGKLVERTFYGPPWVTDTGTPRVMLLIKLYRPLSVCDIPNLSNPAQAINQGGITGLSVPEWLGYTVEWRNGGMRLTKLVGGHEKIFSPKTEEILNPYLGRRIQVRGLVNMANFPTPWFIEVKQVCLLNHGDTVRCRKQQ